MRRRARPVNRFLGAVCARPPAVPCKSRLRPAQRERDESPSVTRKRPRQNDRAPRQDDRAPRREDRPHAARGPRKDEARQDDRRQPRQDDRRDARRGEQRPFDPIRSDARKSDTRPARRERAAEPPRTPPDVCLIFGQHAVREALRAGRRKLLRLIATTASAERLAPEIAASGIELVLAQGEEIARRLPPDSVHQGALLEARPLPAHDIADLPADGLVLVLDQVTDPHNVGAILRTAAAFGVAGLVTTERHAPALTGVLAKTASGGLEHVPVVSVVNLARALEELGDMGYQRIGLDSDGPASLEETPLARPLALVLGAEGKGLRRLTRERCDALARIDLPGAVRSLNVSNACAVALTIARMKLASQAG